MMARLESGKVLLTSTIGEIRGEIVFGVMTWYLAACEFFTQLEAVESAQRRGLGASQCLAGVECTRQLNQDLAWYLRLRDMKDTGKQPFRQIDGYAHG